MNRAQWREVWRLAAADPGAVAALLLELATPRAGGVS